MRGSLVYKNYVSRFYKPNLLRANVTRGGSVGKGMTIYIYIYILKGQKSPPMQASVDPTPLSRLALKPVQVMKKYAMCYDMNLGLQNP